ncbi:extensin isoform X2 [Manihot esculenta]|uniref:X8 domain-containing protein n=1 Tax=Manihot esculenta TaxID=3983 RepID=A0A2C9U9S5_MANES|nr:extensin isoform X2 [Manihot esculenta]OAY26441.1 hypothetical protein MANES_16G047700v8 [Manihot esculenta]
MERNTPFYFSRVSLAILLLLLAIAAINCEARKSMHLLRGQMHTRSSIIQHIEKFKVTKHFDLASLLLQKETMNPSSTSPYVSSPFTLPPYDSLPPIPLPENAPPNCIYPPNTPLPPSTTIPTPNLSPPSSPFSYIPPFLPIPSPPPSPIGIVPSPPETTPFPNPPEFVPSPPTLIPGPPEIVPSPITYIPSPPYPEFSPPSYIPSPPTFVPSPTGYIPSPFLPPVVYPPPTVPPPPRTVPQQALWCVAKPSVPDPIIQEAMNYACASGADCGSIQPNGPCFQPNTLFAHASYAFNSYWQRTKVAGGTCSFGGTAMLVTVDPSFDGCHFVYS